MLANYDTRRLQLLGLILMIGLSGSPSGFAMDIAGKPEIIDGDTLDIGSVRIRLHGIDAAETGQRCVAEDHKFVRPGDTAIDRVTVLGKSGLICTGSETDQFGRLIAVCRSASGLDVGRALVREGLAWAFAKYSGDYIADEQEARKQKIGIWKLACDTPWDFRSKRWKSAGQKAPEGCPIKGNISARGRIYHLPWDRHYVSTKIDTTKGEHWFCDEGQAVAAGWKRALR